MVEREYVDLFYASCRRHSIAYIRLLYDRHTPTACVLRTNTHYIQSSSIPPFNNGHEQHCCCCSDIVWARCVCHEVHKQANAPSTTTTATEKKTLQKLNKSDDVMTDKEAPRMRHALRTFSYVVNSVDVDNAPLPVIAIIVMIVIITVMIVNLGGGAIEVPCRLPSEILNNTMAWHLEFIYWLMNANCVLNVSRHLRLLADWLLLL